MSVGRRIKKIKRKLLLFLKQILANEIYNLIVLLISFNKFKIKINEKKKIKFFSNNLDAINKYEYKITSQNNEDGIIDYLTTSLKNNNKRFIEIGFDYFEFNSLNLIKKGWEGYLIDGDEIKSDKLKVCLRKSIPVNKVKIINKCVNYMNINDVLPKVDCDFFSIDTDGMDYWILKELNLKPKIICLEFNPWMGKDISIAIKRKKTFNYLSDNYYGASINAYRNLLKQKGYKLVAIDSSGNNAFFIIQSHFKFNILQIDPVKSFKYNNKFKKKDYDNELIKLKSRDLVFL